VDAAREILGRNTEAEGPPSEAVRAGRKALAESDWCAGRRECRGFEDTDARFSGDFSRAAGEGVVNGGVRGDGVNDGGARDDEGLRAVSSDWGAVAEVKGAGARGEKTFSVDAILDAEGSKDVRRRRSFSLVEALAADVIADIRGRKTELPETGALVLPEAAEIVEVDAAGAGAVASTDRGSGRSDRRRRGGDGEREGLAAGTEDGCCEEADTVAGGAGDGFDGNGE
jgi:hypothetical protein